MVQFSEVINVMNKNCYQCNKHPFLTSFVDFGIYQQFIPHTHEIVDPSTIFLGSSFT